jgi:triacylglycerol lipase
MTWVPFSSHEPPSTLPNHPSKPGMHISSNVGATTVRFRTKLSSRPMSLNLSPENMPAVPPNSQRSPHKSPHPVLRWFGHTNPSPPSDPGPSTSSSGPHTLCPPASPMENLHEALTSLLPTPTRSTLKRPQKAIPPPMPLSGSPSLLRSLPRVTLPTASLSNLAPAMRPFDLPVDPQFPGAPIFLQHSPPERSSLDFLRSLRDRDRGSSARPTRHTPRASLPSPRALFSTPATPSWLRFQNDDDDKENIVRLLSEEDRGPTVEEERSRIHKKCAWPAVHLLAFSLIRSA